MNEVLALVYDWQGAWRWKLAYKHAADFHKQKERAHEMSEAWRIDGGDEFRELGRERKENAEVARKQVIESGGELLAIKNYCRVNAPHVLPLIPNVNFFDDPPDDLQRLADRMVEVEAALLPHLRQSETGPPEGKPASDSADHVPAEFRYRGDPDGEILKAAFACKILGRGDDTLRLRIDRKKFKGVRGFVYRWSSMKSYANTIDIDIG